jgi:hypothetical protein
MKRAFFIAFAMLVAIAAPAGAAVTVGGLKYSIKDVSVQYSFGSDYMSQKPNGEFIVVRLAISNVGSDPANISASDFQLHRGDTKYDAANTMANTDFFLTKLNPGTSREGNIIFDVPAHTAAEKYQLLVYGNNTGDNRSITL